LANIHKYEDIIDTENAFLPSWNQSVAEAENSHTGLTIQINQPTRYNSSTSLLLDVYVWINTFRASPRPSSGAYN